MKSIESCREKQTDVTGLKQQMDSKKVSLSMWIQTYCQILTEFQP